MIDEQIADEWAKAITAMSPSLAHAVWSLAVAECANGTLADAGYWAESGVAVELSEAFERQFDAGALAASLAPPTVTPGGAIIPFDFNIEE